VTGFLVAGSTTLLKSASMTETERAVRPLRENDLEEWLRLRKLLWDVNDSEDHRHEMFQILGHPESQLVLVADAADGRLIGFLEASIRPFAEDCATDHVGYIEGWFVEPEHRLKGIGRRLVTFAENWARQMGCAEMASDTEVGNDGGVVAHTSLGYKETSRLVHMRKDLN
jgi:aminoglycoside 6'-N-acetyltransferase I